MKKEIFVSIPLELKIYFLSNLEIKIPYLPNLKKEVFFVILGSRRRRKILLLAKLEKGVLFWKLKFLFLQFVKTKISFLLKFENKNNSKAIMDSR